MDALIFGMSCNAVERSPIECIGRGLCIRPWEEFDDSVCAHLAHKFERLLNFPFIDFVNQAGMDTDMRLHSLNLLRRAE
ncbi:MAG: hypothetical protein CUN54_02465 [Phototrophicales bacterium]|nr:MAG: hypothetical protein CUN54_02465 [Phototrophicales bacterium]